MFAKRQPAEPGADHDHMKFFITSHDIILKQRVQKAMRLVWMARTR
jgi:hypothetical protein